MTYEELFALKDKIDAKDRDIRAFALASASMTNTQLVFDILISKIIARQKLFIKYASGLKQLKKLDDVTRKIILYLYKYKVPARKVAQKFGISIRTLRRKLSKLEVSDAYSKAKDSRISRKAERS